MTSASKRKGSGFENDISKFLNKIYNETSFCRTPGSGAFMGRTNSAKRSGIAIEAQITLRGDLITPISFPYIIECKNYNDSPVYHTIIKGPDAKLDQWLKEVEFDAGEAKLQPMLWFKTTRKGVYVAFKMESIDPISPLDFEYFVKYRDYIIISQEIFEKNKQIFWNVVDTVS